MFLHSEGANSRNSTRSTPAEVPHCRRDAEHGHTLYPGQMQTPLPTLPAMETETSSENCCHYLNPDSGEAFNGFGKASALLQQSFYRRDKGTTENSLSTWDTSIANISFRHLSVLSFHPPAGVVTSFFWLLVKVSLLLSSLLS